MSRPSLHDTQLRLKRREHGFSTKHVAEAVGVSTSTLTRIEAGETQPTRRVARALFDLYSGEIPLALIYDPRFDPADKSS